MTPPLVLVCCGKAKGREATHAYRLYRGPYHRAKLAYARSVAPEARIRILSAKHGLLVIGAWVRPYDVTIGHRDAITAEAVRARAAADALLDPSDVPAVLVLGGEGYAAIARQVWGARTIPLADCLPAGARTIGFQVQWLIRHRGSLPPAVARACSPLIHPLA